MATQKASGRRLSSAGDEGTSSHLNRLLCEQMRAVHKVLALNEEISRAVCDPGFAQKPAVQVTPVKRPAPRQEKAGTTDRSYLAEDEATDREMTEPLLEPQSATQFESPQFGSEGNSSSVHQRSNVKATLPPLAINGAGADKGRRKAIFPQADEMKMKIREQIANPEHKVEEYYSESGVWQAIAKNEHFEHFFLLLIVLNALWIAYDTDNNKAEVLCQAEPLFQVVNNFFCLAFTSEIFIRYMAFERKTDCLRDAWFMFDAMLVVLMIWETWVEVAIFLVLGNSNSVGQASIFRIFRMLRLTRVARLARVLRRVPEVMILVKGMVIALRSVCATFALLGVIIYVFAILFTQELSGTEVAENCFDTVPQAANCLLLHGVFSEEASFLQRMMEQDFRAYLVTILFLLLASLTVLNMLIGVVCEVVKVTAEFEKEELMLEDLKAHIEHFVPSLAYEAHHYHHEERVSRIKFAEMLGDEQVTVYLHSAGVDVLALIDFGDFIFRERDEIPLSEFIDALLQFRGHNQATVKDLVDVRCFLHEEMVQLSEEVQQLALRLPLHLPQLQPPQAQSFPV
mmetsp:Transcript_16799/g.38930  ORF Transcript_16799/g.38930 Transcript_16799/m.38930 type:complete len:570 (-) Transcript_16799:52-1761(-)